MSDPAVRRIKSALFVDFDNIYIGLHQTETTGHAARRFADAPERWVRWLAQHLPPPDAGEPVRRDILVRRCYLNPIEFGNQRAMFTTSAFQVVDCPPLTRGGKCSTDIHMVMDVLDALSHPTRFDEFILLSADADFTPLLLRLRAFDRRTVVLAVGPAGQAYKRACDHLIDEDEFIDRALGGVPPPAPPPVPREELLERAAEAVAEAVRRGGGPLAVNYLPRLLRDEFPQQFPDSDWFGFRGLDPLVTRLVSLQPGLRRLTGPDRVEWVNGPSAPAVVVGPEEEAAAPAGGLLAAVRDEIAGLVRAADEPVSLAGLAQRVQRTFGDDLARDGWCGAGSFKVLVRRLDLPDCQFAEVGPGYLFDPARHTAPEAEAAAPPRVGDTHPDLADLAERVHQVTSTPRDTPAAYAAVFAAAADHFETDAADGAELKVTGDATKAIRAGCERRGAAVSGRSITFVLKGLTYYMKTHPEEVVSVMGSAGSLPRAIGELFTQNVIENCRNRQFDPTDEDVALLRRWLLGGLDAPVPLEPLPTEG